MLQQVHAAALILLTASGFTARALAQLPTPVSNPATREAALPIHATGTFEVRVTPQPADDSTQSPLLGRMALEKQLIGDLAGTGKGTMLTAFTAVQGSAGYVATELVTGTLHGRRGSFILQHVGTMTRDVPKLTITVVPDSGTDELVGISGTFGISIVDGKHLYDFEYTLSTAP